MQSISTESRAFSGGTVFPPVFPQKLFRRLCNLSGSEILHKLTEREQTASCKLRSTLTKEDDSIAPVFEARIEYRAV